MNDRLPLPRLESMRTWCMNARTGETAKFCVAGDVTQEEATRFAAEVNDARIGHVWVEVEKVVCCPDLMTPVSVRCTH